MGLHTCSFLFVQIFLNFLVSSSALYEYEIKIASSNLYTLGKSYNNCTVPELEKANNSFIPWSNTNCNLKPGQKIAGSGSSLYVECLAPYTQANEDLRKAICFDGSWFPKEPSLLNTCEPLWVKNALHNNCTYEELPVSCENEVKVGTKAILHCEQGYYTNETLQTDICLANGDWSLSSQRRFRCNPITCEPPDLMNAHNVSCDYNGYSVSCKDNVKAGTRVTWQCKDGYSRNEMLQYDICLGTGAWKSSLDSQHHCTEVTCEPPDLLNAFNVSCEYNGYSVSCKDHAKFGTRVKWLCNYGYSRNEMLQYDICMGTGAWKSSLDSQHHCTEVTCEPLVLETAFNVRCYREDDSVSCKNHVKAGTVAIWQCKHGYSPNEIWKHDFCLITGAWELRSNNEHHCTEITCEPPVLMNALNVSCDYSGHSVSCNDTVKSGTRVTWQCKKGYSPNEKLHYEICEDPAGVWTSRSENLHHCIENICQPLWNNHVLHDNCTYEDLPVSCADEVKEGTKGILRCEEGYYTNEELQTDICLANGNWSSSSKRVYCDPILILPTKPNITRLSDKSVMVQWSVPPNDGLPIEFFKVQYKELGGHNGQFFHWVTSEEIASDIRSYEVDGLHTNHTYKFRIAAGYSNYEVKLGPNSAKFHLHDGTALNSTPLATPSLTNLTAMSPNTIQIEWQYLNNSVMAPVDGFYVYYRVTGDSADYLKATVEGESTRAFNITHLQSDTSYDVKLQAFTVDTASNFSEILTCQTFNEYFPVENRI